MSANDRTTAAIKGQLSKFSGIIAVGLSKAKRRLIKEMVYGIQAGKDIKLSNISRALREPIPLIKAEDRLSRNLDDEDFTDEINQEICRLGSAKVAEDMVIAIDPGDIRKKYAAKMECLCTIHDGSEHHGEKGTGWPKRWPQILSIKRLSLSTWRLTLRRRRSFGARITNCLN